MAENESLDRIGEAILVIAAGHEIRGPPYLRTGIAHCNGKTTPLEHRDIIAAIADDGDLRQRNSQQTREFRHCDTLVGEWMCDVEVVGLRTNDGGSIGQRGSQISLTPCKKLEVSADADDLGSGVEEGSEILHQCRSEPHRALLEPDIRTVGVAHQPVLPVENPDLDPPRIEHFNRTTRELRRQKMLGDHRKIGSRYHPAIETAHGRRNSQGVE